MPSSVRALSDRSYSLPARAGAGLVLAASYATVILTLRRIDLWNAHYASGGPLYLANNLLKLGFFGLSCWLLFALGTTILRPDRDQPPLETAWTGLLAGAAATSLAMSALGSAGLMFFSVVFPVCLLGMALSGGMFLDAVGKAVERAALAWRKRPGLVSFVFPWGLGLLAGVAFLYLAAAKGLYPDVVTNDTVGHYMPYFRDTLAAGRILFAPDFMDYFFCKGAGLHYFFGVLGDVQFLQLATLLAVLVLCLMLAAVTREASGGATVLALAAVVVFLSLPSLYSLEFQKIHALAGAFLIGQQLLLARMASPGPGNIRLAARGCALMTLGLTVLLPLSLMISLPAMAFAAWSAHRRKGAGTRQFAALAGLQAGTALVIFLGNYLAYGLADLSPAHVFFALRDPVRLAKHIDPNAVAFLLDLSSGDSLVVSSAGFIWERLTRLNPLNYLWCKGLPPLWIMLALAAVPALAVRAIRAGQGVAPAGRGRPLPPTLRLYASGSLVTLLVVWGLNVAVKQQSFELSRFGFFTTWHMAVLCMSLAIAGAHDLARLGGMGRATSECGGHGSFVGLAALALVACALAGFPHNLGDDVRETLEFFNGRANYSTRYGRVHTDIPDCLACMPFVPKGSLVLPLNLMSGCYGLPEDIFRPPFYDDHARDFTALCMADAQGQKAFFASHRLDHFLINLATPPLPYVFLNLFAPGSIGDNFRIVARHGPDVYLLGFGPVEGDAELKEFTARLTAYQQRYRDSLGATLLGRFQDAQRARLPKKVPPQ